MVQLLGVFDVSHVDLKSDGPQEEPLPETNSEEKHLKMDGWNTIVFF